MIKTAIIYTILDHCLDLLDATIRRNCATIVPQKPVDDLSVGDLILVTMLDDDRICGAYKGHSEASLAISIYDEDRNDWDDIELALASIKDVDLLEPDDFLDDSELTDDEVKMIEEIIGGSIPTDFFDS